MGVMEYMRLDEKARKKRLKEKHKQLTATLGREQKKAVQEAKTQELKTEISSIRQKRFERRTAPIRSGIKTIQKGATELSKQAEKGEGFAQNFQTSMETVFVGKPQKATPGPTFDPITGMRVGGEDEH